MKNLLKATLLSLLTLSLFIMCGCTNQKIVLDDDTLGLTATFKYGDKEDIIEVEYPEGGAYAEADYVIHAANLEVSSYFQDASDMDFEYDLDSRKDENEFRTVKYSGFDGYLYEQNGLLQFHLYVPTEAGNENNKGAYIYLCFSVYDRDKETNLMDAFNSELVQNYLNRIKVVLK